jgi:hypothetical protein
VLPLNIAFVERHFVARHQIVPAASSSTPELNSQRNLQVGATFVKQLIKLSSRSGAFDGKQRW